MRARTTLAAVAAVIAITAVPALAQETVVPGDFCVEVDHSGQNDFGSPSAARLFLTIDPAFGGTWVDTVVEGPAGEEFAAGPVAPDGLVVIDVPLHQYGEHAVTDGIVDSGGADLPLDTTSLGFVVDASEPRCDAGDLVYVVPSTTTTMAMVDETTTTVVPETTTTVAMVDETTTTAVPETTTTLAEVPVTTDDEGPGAGWVIPVLGGLILVIGGAILWRRPDDPCADELAAWRAAQAVCDEATAAARAAREACTEATTRARDLEDRKRDVCAEWPPACWETDDGGWIEESGRPETRITQRDLHLRRMALGDLWDRHQAGELSAQQVEDAWEEADTPGFREEMRARDAEATAALQRIDAELAEAEAAARQACEAAASAEADASAACDEAAAARAAYEACMAAAAPPPPEASDPGPPEEPTDPTPPTGPSGPAIAPPPVVPGSTPPEEDDEEPVCCPEGMWVGYGWTTGGILGFGVESTIAHFICLCDTGKWITMASRSLRAGLALGGETSLFVGLMWGVEHTAGVPVVWADKSASGWDFDVSLGPSVSKGLKSVVKDVGTGAGWDYLKWAARNKVSPADLDPRRVNDVLGGVKGIGLDAAKGAAKDVGVGQQLDPQLVVVPLGAGLQVGFWHKWCESVRVSTYASCGCTPVDWP